MAFSPRLLAMLCLLQCNVVSVYADDAKKPTAPATDPAALKRVEQLAASAKASVVVINVAGRDGKRQGLGTGFIVSADGLIATNLHVIGEARPIRVQLSDRREFDVAEVHASDRSLDLALLRIKAEGLKPLPLADSEQLKQGQAIVVLGNPFGLNHSIVSGVVSGQREIEGRPMIQLAIPIERGNSGGPLLDLDGRVHGVVTLKSLVTSNLGFAVPSNSLKKLLERPNPMPMARWLALAALDPAEWKPVFGALWRRRAGKIVVEGAGDGFGGRALCLSQRAVPELPYELSVAVRLDDEAGAAGLAFQADGRDNHYGFYPTGGKLRLTHFQGPDVYSWKIIKETATPHYRRGEWNLLRVRLDKESIACFVNGQCVIEHTATDLNGGHAGLAKFRDTRAEFKDFQVAKQVKAAGGSPEVRQRLSQSLEGWKADGPPPAALLESLVPEPVTSAALLRERARQLEQQAAEMRKLAQSVHERRVLGELARVFQKKDDDVDLLHAVLLLARLDNEELDIEPYRREVERMAREVAAATPKDAGEKAMRAALTKYLFTERGFHGSRTDYYNRANSYLNDVMDDREGLPITLSVLYMEVGRRLGLKIVGVPLPGHFMARHEPAEGPAQLLDVFDGAREMSREEVEAKVRATSGARLDEKHFQAATKRAIVVRMLHNLLNVARDESDGPAMLRYLDAVVLLVPESGEERWMRALLRFQSGDRAGARADVDQLLENQPAGVPVERVRELQQALDRPER